MPLERCSSDTSEVGTAEPRQKKYVMTRCCQVITPTVRNLGVPEETQGKAGEKFSANYTVEKEIKGFPAEMSSFAGQSQVTEDSSKMPEEKEFHIAEL